MLLAVISDTHIGGPGKWFEAVYDEYLAQADALLHCGDLTGRNTLYYLMRHPNFVGVCGNCDVDLLGELPQSVSFELAGKKIGACHGFGPRHNLAERLPGVFGPGYDLLFYGHTHIARQDEFGPVAVINPGSLQRGYGSAPSLAHVWLEPGLPVKVEFVLPSLKD